ncbi:MAG: tetratricopeptide repeat protein [Desulfobacterales bacterium]
MNKRVAALFLLIPFIFCMLACSGPEEKKMKYFNKGKKLYENSDYIKAGLEFKNALQIDPKFAQAYYMLGMIEIKATEFRKAFGDFSKAVELDPELLDAQIQLGNIYLLAKLKDKANEKLELVISKKPDYPDALLLKAGLLMADGKLTESETVLKQIINSNPKKEEAYFMLAAIKRIQKDIAGVADIMRSLLAQNPENKRGRLLLAGILEGEKKYEEAEKEYRYFIGQEKEDGSVQLILAGFFSRTGRVDEAEKVIKDLIAKYPEQVKYRISLAQFYEKQKREEQMVAVLNRSVNDLPEAYLPYEVLAKIKLSESKEEEAVNLLDSFMKKTRTGPDFLKAKLFKAIILAQEQKIDQALVLINEIIKENTKDIGAHTLKGDILVSKRDFPGAIAAYRAVIGEQPGNTDMSSKLAMVHYLNGEPAIAEDIYKKLLVQNDTLRSARFGLANIYQRTNKIDMAKEQMQIILKKNPDDIEALVMMGDLEILSKNQRKAISYYEEVIKHDPGSVTANYKMGVMHAAENNYKEAVKYFEKSLSVNPDYFPAMNMIIKIKLNEKKLDEALARCFKQVGISPKNTAFRLMLGQLYVLKKDPEAARNSFETALTINPDSREVLMAYANFEMSQGAIDQAILKYEKLRSNNPDNPGYAILTAGLYEKKGDIKKSRQIYEEVLKKYPGHILASNNLAYYYAEYEPTKENLDKAESLILPLIEKYKESPSVMDTASWIYYHKAQYDNALNILIKIEDKGDLIPEINYHLGMIYQKLGNFEKAKEHLNSAINNHRAFAGKDNAKKILLKLG